MNPNFTYYDKFCSLWKISCTFPSRPWHTLPKRKNKKSKKNLIYHEGGYWPSVKFLIPSYTLEQLLVKQRILDDCCIILDDCWFSLPSEFFKFMRKINKCLMRFLIRAHSTISALRKNQLFYMKIVHYNYNKAFFLHS